MDGILSKQSNLHVCECPSQDAKNSKRLHLYASEHFGKKLKTLNFSVTDEQLMEVVFRQDVSQYIPMTMKRWLEYNTLIESVGGVYDVSTVAKIFGISRQNVYSAIQDGKLAVVETPTGKMAVTGESINHWAKSRDVESEQDRIRKKAHSMQKKLRDVERNWNGNKDKKKKG